MEQNEYDRLFKRIEELTAEVENSNTKYDVADAKRKEAMELIRRCREMLRKSEEDLNRELEEEL